TKVTMVAMYQWAGWTAKRLRASSLIQAKKSDPSQMRGAHSGLRGGDEGGEPMETFYSAAWGFAAKPQGALGSGLRCAIKESTEKIARAIQIMMKFHQPSRVSS